MYYELIKLNTGRNCLKYVIRAFNIRELYIPYYLCPSVRNAVFKEDCKIKFYHINENFYPDIKFPQNAFILYTNYWGVCSGIVDEIVSKYDNVIIDNSHSFFSEPKGIASFNSLRKFFPKLRDGAFLYISKPLQINLEKDDSKYSFSDISYENICKNENRLDNSEIKLISDCTLKYFSKIDLNKEKEERIKNFYLFSEKFNKDNCLKINLKKSDIPFSYPYIASDINKADEIVKMLNKKGVNIYRYWNNLPADYKEKMFFDRLVSIPLI